MNIKIDIDITPEELRRFLGLPDMAGLQEDMMRYVREKMSQGAEGFDPTSFLRETTRGGTRAWQRIMTAAFNRAQEAADAAYRAPDEEDDDSRVDDDGETRDTSRAKRPSHRKATSTGRRKSSANRRD